MQYSKKNFQANSYITCKLIWVLLSFLFDSPIKLILLYNYFPTDLSPILTMVQTRRAVSPLIAVILPGESSSSILVVVAALRRDICLDKSQWRLLVVPGTLFSDPTTPTRSEIVNNSHIITLLRNIIHIRYDSFDMIY